MLTFYIVGEKESGLLPKPYNSNNYNYLPIATPVNIFFRPRWCRIIHYQKKMIKLFDLYGWQACYYFSKISTSLTKNLAIIFYIKALKLMFKKGSQNDIIREIIFQEKPMENIRVMICEVGKKPYVKEIPNELKPMQNIVGGFIEVIPVKNDLLVVCNEEGAIFELPLNKNLGMNIYGNFFVARNEGPEFTSITDEDIEFLNRIQEMNFY